MSLVVFEFGGKEVLNLFVVGETRGRFYSQEGLLVGRNSNLLKGNDVTTQKVKCVFGCRDVIFEVILLLEVAQFICSPPQDC